MPSAKTFLLSPIAALLLIPAPLVAEIYSPPPNVVDPAKRTNNIKSDTSLPFVYLEPHDCCFDRAQPLTVSIYAVNRSGKPITVDWNVVIAALSLEAIGPGRAKPLNVRKAPATAEVPPIGFKSLTIDLKEHFEVEGASVYRLSYARPMDDGRIHIAGKVTFVVEDSAALEKLVESLDAGPARDTVAELLKCNPKFVSGLVPKTYGNDSEWDREMHELRGSAAYTRAASRWEEGIARLTAKDAPAVHVRAVETLIDRLLFLSHNLRVPLPDRAYYQLIRPAEENFPPDARERIHLGFARSHDAWVASQSIGCLMSLDSATRYGRTSGASPPILDLMFDIADGPNKELAQEAISSLSSFRPEPRIVQFLRRKMTDANGTLALHAAIVSCYSGDWSGLPVLLRCACSDDPELRLEAIAQLVDHKFQPHAAKVIPLLLAEIKQPLSDAHLERAVESLGTYKSAEVVEAITPLLEHRNEQVRRRARRSLDRIDRKP